MNASSLQRSVLVFAFIVLVSACGGGGAGDTAAAAGRERALAVPTVGAVDARLLFDWAQYKFPSLFAKGPQNLPFSYLGVNYTIRAYPNGNYLGLTTGGDIYGYGPFTNNVLTPFGKLSDYAAQVVADYCLTDPAGCTNPTPTGSLNECADPAYAALPTGFRLHLVYDFSSPDATGEQIVDSVVDGPATFEGQSATQLSSAVATTFAIQGVNSTSAVNSKSYLQPGTNGLTKNLGSTATSTTPAITIGGITIPGRSTSSKTVFNPPYENIEFTLKVGQSVTITSTQTTTITEPVGTPPTTGSYTRTHTYEARETITVFGKSYDTCRYRTVDATSVPTLSWFIVGKGLPAKTESTSQGQTTRTQLKSGTYNGAPL